MTTAFLVYMPGTHLTFEKPFVKKQDNALVFLFVSAKSVKAPIELSDDCYCNLSVPIPNGQTSRLSYCLVVVLLFSSSVESKSR